ncbi:MAG: sodium:proton antiporter [Gammaproteobacteria bacterium]|nr:sodium:proton antiporter [Gammaproteobacteria bacterium]
MKARLRTFLLFAVAMAASWYVGAFVSPTFSVTETTLDAQMAESGQPYYIAQGQRTYFDAVPIADSRLAAAAAGGEPPGITEEYVVDDSGAAPTYQKLDAQLHWGFWSLLPAVVAVMLCWLTREPVTSLLGGIVSGALVLGQYDLTGAVLIPSLATTNAASIFVLYLWLLGGLMGVWSRTGAAQAFAEFMTRHVVRGPRTAKLTAWMLGVIFFQGGTMSTVLVGTTVKPIADREKVSHEELSYIVDSTSSPIASQLAFNAWPGYVQAFIFVAGVSFLATEADRVQFFFMSVPFCLYAIFAVLGTFLLSVEKTPFLGPQMAAAMERSRTTGALDAEGAEPLSAKELHASHVPEGYGPHVLEFFLPLGTLIGVSIGTFVATGTPNVLWAFGISLLLAAGMALGRGMSLRDLIGGFHDGIKGVVLGSVILLLAITIGGISTQTGGAVYLVELLGASIPYYLLPVLLQLLTMVVAFSTGTSWGTYAVAFPLAMPLAWAVAGANDLAHPQFFMTLCFAAVMDGSVYGDQCSPISDTTVLSSMCTGCDLMDHVRTQIPQASVAAGLAAIGWTMMAALFA